MLTSAETLSTEEHDIVASCLEEDARKALLARREHLSMLDNDQHGKEEKEPIAVDEATILNDLSLLSRFRAEL